MLRLRVVPLAEIARPWFDFSAIATIARVVLAIEAACCRRDLRTVAIFGLVSARATVRDVVKCTVRIG